MISIVIPVYNGEKYLAECIESCLNQAIKEIEIIIVNDGSTDGTQDICNKYFHNYPDKIQVIEKKNGGTASALNLGIDNMKGEWFKWLSADDVLCLNGLEEMMKVINKVHNPYLYLYYTNYDIIDENSMVRRTFTEPKINGVDNDIVAANLYHNFFGNGSTTLICKTALDLVGKFQECMPYYDDYEYWLRWALKFKLGFYLIPITSIRYRVHDNSLTSTKSSKESQKWLDVIHNNYKPYLTDKQKQYLKTLRRPLKSRIAKHLPEPILNRLLRKRE